MVWIFAKTNPKNRTLQHQVRLRRVQTGRGRWASPLPVRRLRKTERPERHPEKKIPQPRLNPSGGSLSSRESRSPRAPNQTETADPTIPPPPGPFAGAVSGCDEDGASIDVTAEELGPRRPPPMAFVRYILLCFARFSSVPLSFRLEVNGRPGGDSQLLPVPQLSRCVRSCLCFALFRAWCILDVCLDRNYFFYPFLFSCKSLFSCTNIFFEFAEASAVHRALLPLCVLQISFGCSRCGRQMSRRFFAVFA